MVGIVVQSEIIKTKSRDDCFSKKLFLLPEMVNQIDCTNDDSYNYG